MEFNEDSCALPVMETIKDAFDKVGVTPEGIYCLDCGQNFAVSTWSRHFRDAHPEFNFKNQHKFAQKIKTKIALARAEEDRSMFAKVPHVIDNKYFCFGCTKVFNFRCNYAIHLKDSKGKATSCAFATKETLPCYQLMDGRFYPVDPPLPPSSRSNIVSPAVHINRVGTVPTLLTPRNANVLPIKPYGPRSIIIKVLSTTGRMPISQQFGLQKTEQVLSKFVKSGDPIDGWVKLFHKRVSTTPNFEEVIRLGISNMDYILLYEKDVGFRKMMDSFDKLEENAMSIINGIPGNWSASTTRFSDQDGESDNTWLFRERSSSTSTQRIEFGRMVAYLRGNLSCNIVHHYLQLMGDPDLTVEEAHATGVVSKFIFELATLEEDTGDTVTWILKYLQARCFTIDGGELRFMDNGRVSSQMSTMTYIIRLSLSAMLNMFRHAGNPTQAFVDTTINLVQKGHVINTMSRWVGICRHNKNKIAQKTTSTITADGTIVCNNAVYPKPIWSRLIPIVNAMVLSTMEKIFLGTKWREFINAFHNQPDLIKVSVLTAPPKNKVILLILFLLIISYLF
jgi:hypothetical protein